MQVASARSSQKKIIVEGGQKMADKNSEDNVIQFPQVHSENSEVTHSDESTSFDLERKKIMISASLVSIVFAATLFNSTLFSNSTPSYEMASSSGSNSRGIASVSTKRIVDWENDLAKVLSKKSVRSIASIGRAPSSQDRLMYGRLGGKYLIRYQQGKLHEIVFQKQPEQVKNDPSYITNPKAFLNEYKDLLPVEFSDAVPKGDLKIGQEFQVYSLKESGKSLAEVKFAFDRFGRLLEMKVVTL